MDVTSKPAPDASHTLPVDDDDKHEHDDDNDDNTSIPLDDLSPIRVREETRSLETPKPVLTLSLSIRLAYIFPYWLLRNDRQKQIWLKERIAAIAFALGKSSTRQQLECRLRGSFQIVLRFMSTKQQWELVWGLYVMCNIQEAVKNAHRHLWAIESTGKGDRDPWWEAAGESGQKIQSAVVLTQLFYSLYQLNRIRKRISRRL